MRYETEKLIQLYFELGLAHPEILSFLAILHRIIISNSTLKRTLKKLRLTRRKNYSDVCDVALFILNELRNSGRQHGYKWMYTKCKLSGLTVSRETVYQLLKILDPYGVQIRKKKRLHRRHYVSNGPDHVWHMDSYDKLKQYGIAINGCIDGFSRSLIWLEANSTNSDPKVIADYYIKAVKCRKGCPQRVRSDMGTENVYVEQMQKFLRRNHLDVHAGEKSFLYGKSTHNQRIEWFWGILRKEVGQFWMDLFADMASCDGEIIFCGTFLDKNILRFCFMDVIQKDLDNLVEIWNTHTINGGKEMHGGNRPIMLYMIPELYNKQHCLCNANETDIDACAEETVPKAEFCCDETVRDLCLLVMEENGYVFPEEAEDARKLYTHLREHILMLL